MNSVRTVTAVVDKYSLQYTYTLTHIVLTDSLHIALKNWDNKLY